jgi:hypothetical protein
MERRTAVAVRYALVLFAVSLPNIGLGLYLLRSSFQAMARSDGTGESLLATIVFVVGLLLETFAVPMVWWGATAFRRDRKANRVRLFVASVLAAGSFLPVALVLHSFRR